MLTNKPSETIYSDSVNGLLDTHMSLEDEGGAGIF